MIIRTFPPILFLLASSLQTALAQTVASPQTFDKDIVPLLTKYCTGCHSSAKPKGKLSLVFTDVSQAGKNKQIWEKVIQRLRAGEMPPKDRPRPTVEELAKLRAWIDRDMLAVDCTGKRDPGRVTIRRLNKAEYNNTLRDLLFVRDFNASDDFPADDVGNGFDNMGDVLTLSPLHLERYLAAAEKAMTLAFKTKAFRERHLPDSKDKVNKSDNTRKTLEKFAARAYRRPVSPDEVARLMRFVALAETKGQTFETGLKLAMQAALVSPHFLFRVEQDQDVGPGLPYRISSFELANRLSYFLWSSMPDDELFDLARSGNLRLTETLEVQVRRMLKDPKSRALTENFAGQWLNLRLLRSANPDPALFRAWGEPLRHAMLRETELFFEAIVKEDRSIVDLLDADFTFVNDVLAAHYGIKDVKGKDFQRVQVDRSQRGGILTHASILTITSNPNRTSPVKRGKWILENILNDPPPPPIPEAGELPEDGKELRGTMRQRMELHRSKPICASCHQRMDPLGFALENYNAVGAWRIKDGGAPIDASGVLPGGKPFQGAPGLRSILKERTVDFRRCLAEKMLAYALGRGIEYYDKCAVSDICTALALADNRFSSLVLAIAKSEPFQLRTNMGGKK